MSAPNSAVWWCPGLDDAPADALKSLKKDVDAKLGAAPQPMPRLHTEGTLPGQGIYDQSVAAKQDFRLMRKFALAWRITGDKRYLDQTSNYLHAWVTTYKPSFNPIDETGFDAVIDTYVIVRDGLSTENRAAAEDFLRRMANGYVETHRAQYSRNKETWINNWHSHRIKLITLAAVALDDPALLDHSRRLYKEQINVNLRADGSVLDFHIRDALHYVVYDLEPLLQAATAAHLKGEDWLRWQGDHGASLAKGLDWLMPYAVGEKTHEEFVKSRVAFDATRRNAGIAGFGGQFNPQKSRPLYWMASVLDPKYKSVAKKLGAPTPEMKACWSVAR